MSGQIPFGRDYPRRSGFFGCKFLRHLLRSGVVYDCGADGLHLLTLVAMTEDSTKYRYAPKFWRNQLLDLLGWSKNKLQRVRGRLVQIGWLHYEPGAKERACIMWVLVPGGDATIDDTPLGVTEGDDLILAGDPGAPGLIPTDGPESGTSVGQNAGHKRARNRDTFYPSPGPTPSPPPSPHGEEEELRKGRKRQSRRRRVFAQDGSASPDPVRERLFSDLVAQASALGVSLAEEAIQSAVCRGASLEHIAAVLQHAAEPPVYQHPVRGAVRPWGGGAVWTRLDNPSHLMKPPSEGWARPDEDWHKLHAKALDAARREKAAVDRQSQRTEAEASTEAEQTRLRQLELQFGEQVNRLTNRDAIELLLAHGPKVSSYLVGHVRKSGTGGRVVRVALLKAFAEKAGSN